MSDPNPAEKKEEEPGENPPPEKVAEAERKRKSRTFGRQESEKRG